MSATTIEVQDKTITLKGVGFEHKITVKPGENIATALSNAGVNASELGVDLLIGDNTVDASTVSHSDVQDNETYVAPPKSPALG